MGKSVNQPVTKITMPTLFLGHIPLIYILALQQDSDSIKIFNDQLVGGSLSMTSVMYY